MAERVDRVAGRALSPRAFRTFGIEAVVLGPPATQDGLDAEGPEGARRQGPPLDPVGPLGPLSHGHGPDPPGG